MKIITIEDQEVEFNPKYATFYEKDTSTYGGLSTWYNLHFKGGDILQVREDQLPVLKKAFKKLK